MNGSIFSFTRRGAKLSVEIRNILGKQGYVAVCYTMKDYLNESDQMFLPLSDLQTIVDREFKNSAFLIFIGACGIAVRSVAPFIRDKLTDPAVISIDEKGQYVIPLLSGHIGGANRLARIIAEEIGAQPVITTATDINGLPAVDAWAKENGLVICDMKAAKLIASALVDGRKTGLCSDFEMQGKLPGSLSSDPDCEAGICLSYDEEKKPYYLTLNLVPKNVCLGIGCRKGISREAIEELVTQALKENKILPEAIMGIASLDMKKEEKGLLEFAEKHKLPVSFFTAAELNNLPNSYDFSSSDFVRKTTGIDNVSERAAVMLSNQGRLVLRKKAADGVTVAMAVQRRTLIIEELVITVQ